MKVRTMKGNMIDMGQLIAKNDKTIAIGNINMNARGDILGKNGEIIKKREETAQEYFTANPKAVKQVALRDISSEVFVTPAEAAVNFKKELETSSAPLSTQKKRKIEDRD